MPSGTVEGMKPGRWYKDYEGIQGSPLRWVLLPPTPWLHGEFKGWWPRTELNRRHKDFQFCLDHLDSARRSCRTQQIIHAVTEVQQPDAAGRRTVLPFRRLRGG